MLIALPPSEGKTAPDHGPSLDWSNLALPQLADQRQIIADQLIEVSRRSEALDLLKVPVGAAGEVADQIDLHALPCAPAHKVYTGVLFQGLDYPTLSSRAKRRAASSVLIFSALFGATRPADKICRYRLTMSSTLPEGSPKAQWKKTWHLLDEMAEGQFMIDGRSGEYAGWMPRGAHILKVGAVRERDGKRQVVTHNAKHYRGLLARTALEASSVPSTPADVADLASDLGLDLELTEKKHTVLTVIDRS